MLHVDDYELILLIFPRQESLVIVVEEVYSLRLLSLEEGGVRVLFIILEEKVISSEPLLLLSGQVSSEKYLNFSSSVNLDSAAMAFFSISFLCSLVTTESRECSVKFVPPLILYELINFSSSGGNLGSYSCFKHAFLSYTDRGTLK